VTDTIITMAITAPKRSRSSQRREAHRHQIYYLLRSSLSLHASNDRLHNYEEHYPRHESVPKHSRLPFAVMPPLRLPPRLALEVRRP